MTDADARMEMWCAGEDWCPVTTTASLVGRKWHPVIVDRTVVNDKPVRVQYSLTELGASLEPVIEAMHEWGSSYLKPPDEG